MAIFGAMKFDIKNYHQFCLFPEIFLIPRIQCDYICTRLFIYTLCTNLFTFSISVNVQSSLSTKTDCPDELLLGCTRFVCIPCSLDLDGVVTKIKSDDTLPPLTNFKNPKRRPYLESN